MSRCSVTPGLAAKPTYPSPLKVEKTQFFTASKYCGSGLKIDLVVVVVVVIFVFVFVFVLVI